ncbi:hypothetical protein GY45DRAFT_1330191 [Cubamyces sp. BRFM 1775]|nr:hypothetical protein GY45DRAFT_1330191 [Cubamyces sp. BRFM 1775]
MSSSSSAGPSRPRVITLTADQLLGTSLTPARPHKQSKNTNAPRVLTIEDLLGPGLTVARPPPRPPAPKPAMRPAPRSSPRASSSTRSAPNPRLVRVTADEVLRTGIPVRTLQAVKARSGQARVLTAEELLAAGSSRSSAQSRGRTAPAAGSSGGGSSRSGGTTADGSTQTTGTTSVGSSRSPRATAGSTTGGDAHNRAPRSGQARRSNSLGSTRTLPMYTQEPGESEVVIGRGATELEDDDAVPITVISPVDEDALESHTADNSPLNADQTDVASSSPTSPLQIDGQSLSQQQSPVGSASPQAIPSSLPSTSHLPPWTALYPDAAPSYEAAMSTPNLHIYPDSPTNIPLPSSPALSPSPPSSPLITSVSPAHAPGARAPSSVSPSPPLALAAPAPRPTVRIQSSQTSTPSPSPRSPASPVSSPGADGADTPRRRFGFMSLFHSRSSTRLRSHSHSHVQQASGARSPIPHIHSHSRTGSASAVPSPRVASPDLRVPAGGTTTRAFHRLSQSASGSMLDLLAVAPRARSRSRSRTRADE